MPSATPLLALLGVLGASALAPSVAPSVRPSVATPLLRPTRVLLQLPAESPQAPAPAPPAAAPGEPRLVGAGVALYLVLHCIGLSVAGLAGMTPATGSTVAARAGCTLAFVGVQQAAGVGPESWLLRRAAPAEWAWLREPAGPVIAALCFAAAAYAPPALLALSGETELAQTLMPQPRALAPGVLADVLLAAPIAEEAFFRGWLLTELERAGASAGAALGISTLLFTGWHLVGNDGGVLLYAALGGWLGLLYQKGGASLSTPIATHVLWNLSVVLARMAAA